MDMDENTRTFQESSFTYNYLLDFVNYYPEYDYIMSVGDGVSIENLITQYKETDWQFIKRLASHFNSFLVPEDTSGNVRYYFGMPKRSSSSNIDPISYKVKKDVEEYVYKTNNDVDGLIENDATYYIVEERTIREIGDTVVFNGKNLYVYSVKTELIGQELKHFYHLKSENGFKRKHYFNDKIIGASLDGNVTDVKQDIVQIHAKVDPIQDDAGTRWFAYSTVYSQPDGSGWYAMPEIGDEIRLYFPSEKEEDSYVISSVHLEVSNGVDRTNPNFKSIKNIYGKEVLFTETTLLLTNNKGMSILIDDEHGIFINSDKDVTISADGSIMVTSLENQFIISAENAIVLNQDDTHIILKDDIVFSGTQIAVQEKE